MTRLHDLYEQQGQSPWIDDLKRSYVVAGGLQRLIDLGIRGVTSNPTIMAKAISEGSDYDEQFSSLIKAGASIDDAYWDMVIADINGALDLFRPMYDESGGADGFVSLEVAPSLAHDSAGTAAAAKDLHERIDKPNLFVKIPASREGIPAIEDTIAAGKNVNVTLIFSLERYGAVIEAYLKGLERLVAAGGDPSRVASVASFFVSRVDTEVDRRLEAVLAEGGAGAKRAAELRGKAAVANAKLAYALFGERFGSPRFAALAAKGAKVQRPLWASTSTKNPAYPDLLYVDGLIGPDTVNTMPGATVDGFLDHGTLARTVDTGVEQARADLAGLAEVGVDLDDVTHTLEVEGIAAFTKSFDDLIDRLSQKADALSAK
ncbi:MAG: transaldolase [Actinomycetota bacterium]|nr:transaldolase [Actinomycetota bacterium]